MMMIFIRVDILSYLLVPYTQSRIDNILYCLSCIIRFKCFMSSSEKEVKKKLSRTQLQSEYFRDFVKRHISKP